MYQFNDQGNLRDFAAKQVTFFNKYDKKRTVTHWRHTVYKNTPLFITDLQKSLIRVK
jgi:hypothetical protein